MMSAMQEQLQCYLIVLIDEVGGTKQQRMTIESLITIYRNLLINSNDEKYRRLNISNPTFHQNIWRFHAARCFMKKTGWQQRENQLFFCEDSVKDVLEVLLNNRLVMPVEAEWTDDNKKEGESEQQLREEELRRNAVAERNKELEEFLKDKKYREELAKNVREEHHADKYRRRVLNAQVANKLTPGATIKRLH